MFTKNLQGATVERVYWTVRTPNWLPTTGTEFDSPLDARKYAEDAVTANSPRAAIETRMVFRYRESYPIPGTVDIAVATEYADYNELIRRPAYEDRY